MTRVYPRPFTRGMNRLYVVMVLACGWLASGVALAQPGHSGEVESGAHSGAAGQEGR